ncbi:adenylosuccinate lyase [Scatolibacter rhodanostii]|uniref:adenylosuccinate lyase n=1 Tax=Scatolibacter rhodanostii TaxID=2014781 RepID=UPI000C0860B3|nr:adenylosuccinate lyase [Scatolibacter rhodanostii]
MGSHVMDLTMLKNNFGTEKMRLVWDDKARMSAQLQVEAALAKAEADLGLISKEAAEKIVAASDVELYNIEEIAAAAAASKHSLMATISALQVQSGNAGEFVHYGATTQDIVDTGMMLQLKKAYNYITEDVNTVIVTLAKMAKKYQSVPMVGRTHAMHALPITFGYKLAVWLDEFGRHRERLEQLKDRVFTGSMSGAVGTYASFGPLGSEVEKKTMEYLGLHAPNICWQSARDRFAEYASVLASISATMGKTGNEFYNLMRTEIGEIEEQFTKGKIGSSTMPHKRNPAAIEGLASLTPAVLQSVGLIYQSAHMEHERDAMAWRLEWIALPEMNTYVSYQLVALKAILDGITVNKEKMYENLNLQYGLLLSEKVMFEVGEKLGKQTAHHVVYEASMKSYEEKRSFGEVLLEQSEIAEYFDRETVESWLVPEKYTGLAEQKVDEVIQALTKKGYLTAQDNG